MELASSVRGWLSATLIVLRPVCLAVYSALSASSSQASASRYDG